MKLYKLTVHIVSSYSISPDKYDGDYYVVAENETQAVDLLKIKWKDDWKYSSDMYVRNIELIADEYQYGRPNKLIVLGNDHGL